MWIPRIVSVWVVSVTASEDDIAIVLMFSCCVPMRLSHLMIVSLSEAV